MTIKKNRMASNFTATKVKPAWSNSPSRINPAPIVSVIPAPCIRA